MSEKKSDLGIETIAPFNGKIKLYVVTNYFLYTKKYGLVLGERKLIKYSRADQLTY